MSHLSILINDIPVTTSTGASIDIEDKNPLFNDEEMFSYPIEIPFDVNRRLTESLESPQSGLRPVDLEHSPMRLVVDGLPFRSGTAKVQDGEELESAASVSMEASDMSFSDLISDLECNDIPLCSEVKIGEKLGAVTFRVWYETHVKIDIKHSGDDHYYIRNKDSYPIVASITPQALGFSQPYEMTSKAPSYNIRSYNDGEVKVPVSGVGQKFINVSSPYDYGSHAHPYCNARVCYKHYAKAADGSTDDSTVKKSDSAMAYEDIYPYWVLDADRPQSGICFYILYFLECLFHHLDVQYDLTAIAKGDFLRLCFYTTKCKYTESVNTSRSTLNTKDEINTFLDHYGCGGRIEVNDPDEKSLDQVTIGHFNRTYVKGENSVRTITVNTSIRDWEASAVINNMYATSDNFPEMTVQALIDSLENQFGIKFHYDYQSNKVTAYLLRDVFRDQTAPIQFAGTIDSITPISEKITGVRCGYSDESDKKEQQDNIRNGVKDYDTSYDYCDYPEGRVVYGSNLYEQIFKSPSNTDMNVYIDKTTGNKYRVKIDSDYTNSSDMHPVLFEVGQWKSVEEGDCSAQNEDFVKELKSDLQPLPLNDINYYRELAAFSATSSNTTISDDGTTFNSGTVSGFVKRPQPILCAYMDEEMEHEFIEQRINNLLETGSSLTDIYATEVLSLVESYDPTSTDDGNSPLQSYDWGNAIAIMRGGGNDSQIENYDYDYDLFSNSKWMQTVGAYALTTDTMDAFGNVYDYNGTASGLGYLDGCFSLKPRAYVSLPDIKVTNRDNGGAMEKVPGPLVQDDAFSSRYSNTIRYKSRGYVDQFLSELIYFYLHRKYFKITVKTTAAALADIPNHWRNRWNVGGIQGYIDKVSYSVTQEKGIEYADLYFFAI